MFPLLDPRKRRIGRWILWGGLGALLAGMIAVTWWLSRSARLELDQSWTEIDFASLPEVRMLQDYVRVDTSSTTGSEVEGALFLARQLERIGLEPHLERLGEDHANLWAIVEGEDPAALVLHSHIDVYPVADPDAWDHPPFDAVIDPPFLYGRGAFDMKSVAVAQLLALAELQESGRRPRRSVIFLATGSEEVGSELGTRWILDQHPELAERFWAVLTEGGVVEPVSRTEIKYWGIEFAQKRFANGYLCSDSREALELLRREIQRHNEEWRAPRRIPEVARFLDSYAKTRVDEIAAPLFPGPTDALRDPRLFRELPAYLRSLFRDEVVPFQVEEDAEGGYRMRLVFHLLPGQELEDVREELLPPWMVHGFPLVLEPALGSSTGSPLEHPLYRALVEAVASQYPETTVGPYLVPWSATDARFFRAAGIPAYGFSPFVIFNTDTFRVDGTNERIGLPGFLDGVELYRGVVLRLAG